MAEYDSDKWQWKARCSQQYYERFSTVVYFKITLCISGTTTD